jgi:uncharacterized protein YndB with AHSA1/START domain
MSATANKPGTTVYELPSDREIRFTRVFDAPLALVYACYTEPEHLRNWMTGPEGWTMIVCDVARRPGDKWYYAWRNADGAEMGFGGVSKEITPLERLVATSSWGPEWPESLETVEFQEQEGRTIVTTTILYASKEVRNAALETGMKEGMDVSFSRLDEYLRRAVDHG